MTAPSLHLAIALALTVLGRPALAAPADPAPCGAAGGVFSPCAGLDLAALLPLVATRTPALQEPALAVDLGRAELKQSRLLDNPVLDVGVGTLPLGATNPPDLPSPLTSVPNYGVGLSYPLDLWRRGPRQARARALLRASEARFQGAARERALALARVLGALAALELRREADRGLAEQARASLQVARERVRAGFGTPIDADRAEVELLSLQQQVNADDGQIAQGLAECAEILGLRCRSFSTTNEGRAFLDAWTARARPSTAGLEGRPDLRALQAQQQGARAELRLGRLQALPTPTLRLGYLYDSFVVSGNQLHSMSLGLTLPLPLFDHGQAAVAAAQARIERLGQEQARLREAAAASIDALAEALRARRERRIALQQQVLPRARAILEGLTRAFEARALRLTELIQARRNLDELLLAEADTLNDEFNIALDLMAQLPDPTEPLPTVPARR